MRTSKRSGIWVSAALLVAGGSLLPSTTTQAAGNAARGGDHIGTPQFKVLPSNTGVVSPDAITIPRWTSRFTDPISGRTYNYTMVGTDPAKADVSTTIPTVIVPMNFNFTATGTSLNGIDKVDEVVGSPVFRNADIGAAADAPGSASAPPQPPDTPPGVAPDPRVINEPSDVTQVGDAIYRAQFAKTGSGWHVRLGQPDVAPAVTIDVPKNQGFTVIGSSSGSTIGLMSYSWFTSKLTNLMATMKVSPKVLPIFLVNNTMLYSGTPDNCCVFGYHGATGSLNGNGKQQVNTYMFASYVAPNVFGANAGDTESYISDIHGLTHEVQEWYDDPFINNHVSPWLTPTAAEFYGCSDYLEVGDPVVGYGFKIRMLNGITYHPEDEIHLSWFARESPSRAEQGYYSYLNNFADRAHGC